MLKITIKLDNLLKERAISQRELARQTDIRLASINEMCKNETVRVPLDNLAKICCTLNCGVSDVLELVCEDKEDYRA